MIGIAIITLFILVDLSVLPNSLKPLYFISRLGIQLPCCLLFLSLTYTPFYLKIHQVSVFILTLVLIYSNYWLIVQCWQLEQFSFRYEGTIIYSLFALFIFRIRLEYTLALFGISLVNYIVLALSYPIYEDPNVFNLLFLFTAIAIGFLGIDQISRVVKELRAINKKLMRLNQIDQLTNIYNRGAYEQKFSEQLEMNKRSNNGMCIFLIDLDAFKKYNDGYGHVQGDKIISLQAKILSQIFSRTNDIVARYGGEEFVVITSIHSESECENMAKKIVNHWREHKVTHTYNGNKGYVTCSVGFHFEIPDRHTTKQSMVEKADLALYQAKNSGRDSYVKYQEHTIESPKNIQENPKA